MRSRTAVRALLGMAALVVVVGASCEPLKKEPPKDTPPQVGSLRIEVVEEAAPSVVDVDVDCVKDGATVVDEALKIDAGDSETIAGIPAGATCDVDPAGPAAVVPAPPVVIEANQTVTVTIVFPPPPPI